MLAICPAAAGLALAVAVAGVAPAASRGCQRGAIASAPFIGAADMRAIDKAARQLPNVAPRRLHASIGAAVPADVERAPVPAALARVLPQYESAGYSAFRVNGRLVIVDRRGVLSYLLPLGVAPKPGNCP